jgi:hypothetical protein
MDLFVAARFSTLFVLCFVLDKIRTWVGYIKNPMSGVLAITNDGLSAEVFTGT